MDPRIGRSKQGLGRLGRLALPLSGFQRMAVGRRLLTSPRLPDFLGIGVPKAGTTWLYNNLRCHPQLYLPPKKELHYFDTNWFQPLNWYSRFFEEAGERIAGEITPAYCHIELPRIRTMFRLMPGVRLVMLLRDPVERDWSAAKMHVLRRGGIDPNSGGAIEGYFKFLRSSPSAQRGRYVEILAKWLSVFPKESLFIGFYEELATRPHALLIRVLEHLGVSGPTDLSKFPLTARFLEGVSVSIPDSVRDYLIALHAPSRATLSTMLGDISNTWTDSWSW